MQPAAALCLCPEGPERGYEESLNTEYCKRCGHVLEVSAIVTDVEFSEAPNGRTIATGAFLAADETGERSQLGRRGGGLESRQITLANGHQNIHRVGNGMRLGSSIVDHAVRLFNLAVSNGFVQGRRTDHVVAACLYMACRLEETSTTMLIDFSDFLRINVFVLGSTFLKLTRALSLHEQIKPIDPSLFIHRFAALLDFGDETQKVAMDAVRLVQRFERDWMTQGRRPAGICGACLLLAARMNHFRRSVEEIVQVVKIADVTVKRRLEEFKQTASGQLSIEDFRSSWLPEASDPPAFTQSLKREAERQAKLVETLESSPNPDFAHASPPAKMRKIGDAEASSGHGGDAADGEDSSLSHEVANMLASRAGKAVTDELDEQERAALLEAERKEQEHKRAMEDLDEAELDAFILSPEEVQVKERLWVLNNKDYLEVLAEKHLRGEGDEPKRRRRKKASAPRDSSTPAAATASEAARQLLVKKKISRKLDYSAFENLWSTPPKSPIRRRDSVFSSSPIPTTAPNSAHLDQDTASSGSDDRGSSHDGNEV